MDYTIIEVPDIFQSTLPSWGATVGWQNHGRTPSYFNPSFPFGERHRLGHTGRLVHDISTQDPLAGSDGDGLRLCSRVNRISTPAPLAGSNVPSDHW